MPPGKNADLDGAGTAGKLEKEGDEAMTEWACPSESETRDGQRGDELVTAELGPTIALGRAAES
jgi:hypothetical protein